MSQEEFPNCAYYKCAPAADRPVLEKLIQRLRACPEAEALWKDVENKGKFSVKLGSRAEIQYNARWETATRTIRVRRVEPDDHKVAYTLFELCNGKFGHDKALTLGLQSQRGLVGRQEYITRMVEAEFDSVACHQTITDKCGGYPGWNREHVPYHTSSMKHYDTFEQSWQDYQNDPHGKVHIAYLARQWAKVNAGAYCRKHPNAAECL